jgi:hypothetical protein
MGPMTYNKKTFMKKQSISSVIRGIADELQVTLGRYPTNAEVKDVYVQRHGQIDMTHINNARVYKMRKMHGYHLPAGIGRYAEKLGGLRQLRDWIDQLIKLEDVWCND